MILGNNIMHDKGKATASPLLYAYFGNCIVNGNGDDEIEQDSLSGVGFNFLFDHCLVQTGLVSKHQSAFMQCIVNKEAKFVDPWNGYFELDTLSPAKDSGALSIINLAPVQYPVRYDLKGIDRFKDTGPDMGVYEREENK